MSLLSLAELAFFSKEEPIVAGIYKLYGRQASGSLAVQVALEEAGAAYERVWIGREPAEVDRFRSVNPTGRVPALLLPDGVTMIESAAMLIHLAAVFPKAKLAPAPGTTEHAVFLQWMVFLSANVYESALRMYYSARYSNRGDSDAEAIRAQASTDYCASLAIIGRGVLPYVLGREYSIADVYLYMLVSWYPGDKPEFFRQFPGLAEHSARILARPAVAKVEADHAA
jgi:glutathione S-transferase